MLKGWFDRMFGPGIAMDLSDPSQAKPLLLQIKCITGISTYGRPRGWQAIGIADPPRKIIKRYLPWFTGSTARVLYLALCHDEYRNTGEARRFSEKGATGDGALLEPDPEITFKPQQCRLVDLGGALIHPVAPRR